jgi:two-component system, OmpR family, sensor kinase
MVKSIRARLLLWYAVVLTGVVGGFAGVLYYEVRAARLAEIDAQLEAAAAGLESALRLFPQHELTGQGAPPPPKDGPPPKKKGPPFWPPGQPDPGTAPLGREYLMATLELPGPPGDKPEGMYFAVWRSDGSLIKTAGLSASGMTTSPTIDRRPTLGFDRSNRELWMHGPSGTTIIVGRPAGHVMSYLRTFAWQLAGTGVAVLAFGLAGGWLISRRIFRPIAAIAKTASRISADNLSARIDTDKVDRELADLARVLNATFRRLEAAFDRQARFTADASHELRTPLAVIRSQAELTLSRLRSTEEYQEALQTCVRASARMAELVDGLLALARLDAGKGTAIREPVELHRVAGEAAELCRTLADTRRVRLTTELASVTVTGDPNALARVVGNLIANAIQYNRSGGEVHVSLGVDGREAVLAVRDTGEGIPEDHHAHLFERFYRADKARSRATGGSGLGLAIAKGVVEAHGGSIGFRSVVGKGSEFWVRLPRKRGAG